MNLQMVPWTLSKPNHHSSFHKNKKESRHSCRRMDWFSFPGRKYTSVLFLNLLIIWLCSTLSLPGDFAHHGTEAKDTSIWVLASKRGLWRADYWSLQRSWAGHLVDFSCPISMSSFCGQSALTFRETLASSLLIPCDSINTDPICWLCVREHDLDQAYQSHLVLRVLLKLLGNKALFWEMNFSLSYVVLSC